MAPQFSGYTSRYIAEPGDLDLPVSRCARIEATPVKAVSETVVVVHSPLSSRCLFQAAGGLDVDLASAHISW